MQMCQHGPGSLYLYSYQCVGFAVVEERRGKTATRRGCSYGCTAGDQLDLVEDLMEIAEASHNFEGAFAYVVGLYYRGA